MPDDPISVDDLRAALDKTLAEIHADIDAREERFSLQEEARDDAKSTSQRAIEALMRPERFKGEHSVARAWLREQAPHLGIFKSYDS